MNLRQSLDPSSQNARHRSKYFVQSAHFMKEIGPWERKRLTQCLQGVNVQARLSQHLLSWLPARSSYIHYFGDRGPAKCPQLCWRPEDLGVGWRMVSNKLSLGCGHSRSSSQCILIVSVRSKLMPLRCSLVKASAPMETPKHSFQANRTKLNQSLKPSLVIDYVSPPSLGYCQKNSQWLCLS